METVIATDDMDLTDVLAESVQKIKETRGEAVKMSDIARGPSTSRVYMSHKGCGHPLTPKARAACRAGNVAPVRAALSVIQLSGSKTWHLANVADEPGTMSGVVCTGKPATDGRYLLDTDDVHPVTCKNCLKKINK